MKSESGGGERGEGGRGVVWRVRGRERGNNYDIDHQRDN